MAKIKLKGWDTGFNKLKMTEILITELMLDETQTDELFDAVSAGQVMTLEIEDEILAQDLSEKLVKVGAILEIG